jgi:hypothetical protein
VGAPALHPAGSGSYALSQKAPARASAMPLTVRAGQAGDLAEMSAPGDDGRRGRGPRLCDSYVVGEWTEIACVEPSKEQAPFTIKQEVSRALDSFLSERGMTRSQVSDDDIRIDLLYLGPAEGVCAHRVMIRPRALS